MLSGMKLIVHEYDPALNVASDIDLAVYDLILLNFHATPNVGATICQQLRVQYRGPILVLIYEKDEEVLIHLYEAGADACLLQPMSGKLLLAIVQAWLRRAQMSL